MHDDIERVLFDESRIRAGIERVAREIAARFAGRELTVVAVLKGSCIFVADLIRRLPLSIELAFVWAESYRRGTSGGRLELLATPTDDELRGRSVLLVDDILDSGRTLSAVRDTLVARGASEVATCVFLDKPARREVALSPDFVCFEVEDLFVVGYGLDFAGRYRNLPYVAALKPTALASGPVGPAREAHP